MEKIKSPRQYPNLYEKLFPIVLGFLGIIIVMLLIVTIAVALRLVGTA